jgi:ankyrin repeat protein
MPTRELPRHPSVEQYRKQAKELVRFRRTAETDPRESLRLTRLFKLIEQYHPQFRLKTEAEIRAGRFGLSDAQLVIAREHGFASWTKFAGAIEVRRASAAGQDDTAQDDTAQDDAETAFLRAASVPREAWHVSGMLDAAEAVRAAHPGVEQSSIYTAAVFGDAAGVRRFLAADGELATARGGVHVWDALTYLCFSRYLRVLRDDAARSRGFVDAARALLDAGASADTGWFEANDEAVPFWEPVIYGAAGIAQHADLTQLLLERGADPNDEETPYHAAETRDLRTLRVMLESGKLSEESVTTLLLRKADWHDLEGMRLLLAHGGDAHRQTRWKHSGLMQAVRRDNGLELVEALLGDLRAGPEGLAADVAASIAGAACIAAWRGRGDVLRVFEQRGIMPELHGIDELLAVCAQGDGAAARAMVERDAVLAEGLKRHEGAWLSFFAGNGNVEGVAALLDLGVNVGALNLEGDAYYEIARGSTALHCAAWRMRHGTVQLLLERGSPVNALDGRGRTPLALAVKACVDSHWAQGRSLASIEMLLRAGATVEGIALPTGYAEADACLREYGATG